MAKISFEEFKRLKVREDRAWGFGGRKKQLEAEYQKYLDGDVEARYLGKPGRDGNSSVGAIHKPSGTNASSDGELRAVVTFVAIIAGAFFLIKWVLSPQDPGKAERSAVVQCEDEYTAFAMSQEFVKGQLRAPATAKFPSTRANGVRITYLGDCTHQIVAYVDSQNGFGALLRNRYYAKVQNKKGTDTWLLLDLSFFDE